MTDWCMAHPWMTFVILFMFVGGTNISIRIPTRRRDKEGN